MNQVCPPGPSHLPLILGLTNCIHMRMQHGHVNQLQGMCDIWVGALEGCRGPFLLPQFLPDHMNPGTPTPIHYHPYSMCTFTGLCTREHRLRPAQVHSLAFLSLLSACHLLQAACAASLRPSATFEGRGLAWLIPASATPSTRGTLSRVSENVPTEKRTKSLREEGEEASV